MLCSIVGVHHVVRQVNAAKRNMSLPMEITF